MAVEHPCMGAGRARRRRTARYELFVSWKAPRHGVPYYDPRPICAVIVARPYCVRITRRDPAVIVLLRRPFQLLIASTVVLNSLAIFVSVSPRLTR